MERPDERARPCGEPATAPASAVPLVPLTFSATGLPAGLSVNAASGLIRGTVEGALEVYTTKAS